MIGTQGEHGPKAAHRLKGHQKIDHRSALLFCGFSQKLLELIHDQEGFCCTDRQIATDRIGCLARIGGIDPLPAGATI